MFLFSGEARKFAGALGLWPLKYFSFLAGWAGVLQRFSSILGIEAIWCQHIIPRWSYRSHFRTHPHLKQVIRVTHQVLKNQSLDVESVRLLTPHRFDPTIREYHQVGPIWTLNSLGTGSFALPWSTASVSSPPPSHWLPRWHRSCRRSKRWVGWVGQVGVSSFFLAFLLLLSLLKAAKPAKHHLSQHVLVTIHKINTIPKSLWVKKTARCCFFGWTSWCWWSWWVFCWWCLSMSSSWPIFSWRPRRTRLSKHPGTSDLVRSTWLGNLEI